MTCAWQETDTVPPVTVHVLTTVAAVGCAVAVVAGPDGRVAVRVAVSELEGVVVSDDSSEVGFSVEVSVVVAGLGASVWPLLTVAVAGAAVAAWSLSETWGPVRMFVEAPSLNTATACHTTKLVTTVARTHDVAAIPAIRRRDVLTTHQS
jgi:hypothetical protein